MKKHKHNWKMTWRCGSEISEKCECGDFQQRPASKSEMKRFAVQQKEQNRRRDEMFSSWRSFNKRFPNWKVPRSQEETLIADEIDQWVRDNKIENVEVLGCDDTHHTSSDLILFHHIWKDKGKKKCWGTTVLFFAQCDGQPPTEFFLYPGHTKGLIDSLQRVWKIRERR